MLKKDHLRSVNVDGGAAHDKGTICLAKGLANNQKNINEKNIPNLLPVQQADWVVLQDDVRRDVPIKKNCAHTRIACSRRGR